MDYDDSNPYGDYNYSDDASGEFTDDSEFNEEMSAEEMIAQFGQGDTLGAIQGYQEEQHSPDERMGGMTAADLQLRRLQGEVPSDITGYSMGTRMAIKDLTSGNFRKMNTFGVESIAEIDAIRSRAANALEVSPEIFSGRMKTDPSQVGEVTNSRGQVITQAGSYGASEVRQGIKFLEGIGLNLDVGPGGRQKLDAGSTTPETREKQDEDMSWAMATMGDIAGRYLHSDTASSAIGQQRLDRTTQQLIDRAIDGSRYSVPGASGSYTYDEKKKLPAPLDLNVPGLIDNLAVGGLAAGKFVGGSEFTSRGYQEALIAGQHSEEYLAAAAPSVQRSLFPKPRGIVKGSAEETQYYADRASGFRSLEADYAKASSILNQQLTTNFNEDQGKNTRWSGYGIDPERGLIADLREQSDMLDLDWLGTDPKGRTPNTDGMSTMDKLANRGSDRAGMYGSGEFRSESDDFIERALEDSANAASNFIGPMPPTQGGATWLEQRKGLITASTAATLFGKNGVEQAAISLANERLGNTGEFISSGHVAEGSKYEDKVAAAFMNSPEGQGLEMREAFFETNKAFPGFGVSPDASLYDKDGDRYLAEFKFLASDQSMAQSKKAYAVQVQEQMMVTGAKGVYFSRMNKRTGELQTDLIKPDLDVQAEIAKRGTEALALSETLDAEGVSVMAKRLASRPARQADMDAGPATVMNQAGKMGEAKATVLGALSSAPKSAMAAAISGGAQSSVMGGMDQEGFNTRVQKEENIMSLKATAVAAAGEAMADSTDATRDRADADAEAARSVRQLGTAARKAAAVMSELAGVAMAGNATQMGDIRLADSVGADVNEVRGIKDRLRDANVTLDTSSRALSAMGGLSTRLAAADSAGDFTKEFAKWQGVRGVNNASILAMPDQGYQDWQGLSAVELTGKAMDMAETLDPAGQRDLFSMLGLPLDMITAVGQVTGEEIRDAQGNINRGERLDTDRGLGTVEKWVRDAKEWMTTGATGGEFAGQTVGAAEVVGAVAGSSTIAGAVSIASKGKYATTFSSAAKTVSSAATRVVTAVASTGALPFLSAAGVGAASGAFLTAGDRNVRSWDDENQRRMSGATLLGNASTSIVPTVPEDRLGSVPYMEQDTGSSVTKLNSNVTVNVEVSSEGVTTEVDDNGINYVDTDNTFDLN